MQTATTRAVVKIGHLGAPICVVMSPILVWFAAVVAWGGESPASRHELLAIASALAAVSFLVGAWGILFWLNWTRYSTLVTCCLIAPVYFGFLLRGYDYHPFFDLSSSLGVLLCLGIVLLAVWLCLSAVRQQFKNGGVVL